MLVGLSTVLAGQAFAGAGDLFGHGGRILLDAALLGSRSSAARSLVQQNDGKIVVAGNSSTQWDSALVVARFEPHGALDATFANGGIATGTLSGDAAAAIIQQSDGKLVVAGRTSSDLALWRFLSNGTADAGFGASGAVRLDLGGTDRAYALLQQPNGKLVAAGTTSAGEQRATAIVRFNIVRFNEDGSLDGTFGSQGTRMISFPDATATEVARSLIQHAIDRCRCELSLFGRNLTNEKYFVSGAADSTSNGTAEVIMAGPREWGLRIAYRFD